MQNYLLPTLERPVFKAAHTVGAKVAVVVHDGRLHTWREGTGVGLVRNLRAADAVVVHSEHVAATVRRDTSRRDVVVMPLPVPIGMLSHTSTSPPVLDRCEAARWCGHFGVVRRHYKGTQVVAQLAAGGVDGWRFAVLGAGAEASAGVHSVPGYLESGDLVAAVSASDATIAPYKLATQSAVVVLAHVLGSVPIASSVGGIPEQIAHGVDGILVAAWCRRGDVASRARRSQRRRVPQRALHRRRCPRLGGPRSVRRSNGNALRWKPERSALAATGQVMSSMRCERDPGPLGGVRRRR